MRWSSRFRAIDGIMAICVLLAIADQISDVLFAVRAFQADRPVGAAALLYVCLYPCMLAFQLCSAGNGIYAVLRALTGVELIFRAWQALCSLLARRRSEEVWRSVNALFSLESILEGAPLLLLASVFLHKPTLSDCSHMNCNRAAFEAEFPAGVLPAFNSTEPFMDEYVAAMQTHEGCTYHPITSDGWFTTHAALRPGEFRDHGFMGRPMAFRLDGVRDATVRSLSDGVFACVAVIPPRFNMWLAWIEQMVSGGPVPDSGMHGGEAAATLSLVVGLVCLITHQVIVNMGDTDTSLWAFDSAGAFGSQSEAGALARGSAPSDAAAPRPRRRSTVLELTEFVQLNLGRERRWRNAHSAAVCLFFTVDVFASMTLYFELVVITMFVIPWRVTTVSLNVYLFAACAIKTTIVAGWQRGHWVATFPRAQWAARRGPWCRAWLTFIVALTERFVLISMLTTVSRIFPRADHVLWQSIWRRLALLWALCGTEILLIGAVTWTKARTEAVTLDLKLQSPADRSRRKTTASILGTGGLEGEEQSALVLPQPRGARGRSTIVPLPPQEGEESIRKEAQPGDEDVHAG